MGTIIIHVPQDVRKEFNLTDEHEIEALMKQLKGVNRTRAKCGKSPEGDIVGLWQRRFDERVSSASIQKTWRESMWKRS